MLMVSFWSKIKTGKVVKVGRESGKLEEGKRYSA